MEANILILCLGGFNFISFHLAYMFGSISNYTPKNGSNKKYLYLLQD